MSISAVTLPSQHDTLTRDSEDPSQDTGGSASNAGTESYRTHEAGSDHDINTLDGPDDRVIQDLWGLLANMRPDHLYDPDRDGWAALIATLSEECDDYVTEGRTECVCVVPKYLSIGLPVTFGRVGVESRLVTCMMTIGTDGVRLIPHDVDDGERQRERCLENHSVLNARFETAIIDHSGPGNFTLKQLLEEVNLNERKAKTILGNENDSAGWRVLTDTTYSLFIGVMDTGEDLWYDALEKQDPRVA